MWSLGLTPGMQQLAAARPMDLFDFKAMWTNKCLARPSIVEYDTILSYINIYIYMVTPPQDLHPPPFPHDSQRLLLYIGHYLYMPKTP